MPSLHPKCIAATPRPTRHGPRAVAHGHAELRPQTSEPPATSARAPIVHGNGAALFPISTLPLPGRGWHALREAPHGAVGCHSLATPRATSDGHAAASPLKSSRHRSITPASGHLDGAPWRTRHDARGMARGIVRRMLRGGRLRLSAPLPPVDASPLACTSHSSQHIRLVDDLGCLLRAIAAVELAQGGVAVAVEAQLVRMVQRQLWPVRHRE